MSTAEKLEMTEEEITEQAVALVLGAINQLPEERRLPWLQNFVSLFALVANPEEELKRLMETTT